METQSPMKYDIKQLSHSQIGTWKRCSRLWEIQYVEKKRMPVPGLVLLGRVYHDTVATLLKARKSGIDDWSKLDSREVFSEKWKLMLKDEGDINWGDFLPDYLYKQGEILAKKYNRIYVPKTHPVLVEESIVRDLDSFRIKGVLDYIDDKPRVGLSIIDHKITTFRMAQIVAERNWQVLTYFYLVPEATRFEFHRALFTATPPKLQILKVTRDQAKVDKWATDVLEIHKNMCEGNVTTMFCKKQKCEYYEYCKGQAKGG